MIFAESFIKTIIEKIKLAKYFTIKEERSFYVLKIPPEKDREILSWRHCESMTRHLILERSIANMKAKELR